MVTSPQEVEGHMAEARAGFAKMAAVIAQLEQFPEWIEPDLAKAASASVTATISLLNLIVSRVSEMELGVSPHAGSA